MDKVQDLHTYSKIDTKPYGVIYITTNTLNGMKYIGQKKYIKGQVFNAYLGSGIRLQRAVKKYGAEHFIKEILCECNSREDMNEMEKYYITYYGAITSDLFYNIALGGDGGDMSHCKNYNKVCQYNLDGKLIAIYSNAKEAERAIDGQKNKSIIRCCHNLKHKNRQFMFKFFHETNGKDIAPYIATQGDYLKRKVDQLSLSGEYIKTFDGISMAERALGVMNISAAISGKQKSAGGFKWRYTHN